MKGIVRQVRLPDGRVMDWAVGSVRYVPPREWMAFNSKTQSWFLNMGHFEYVPPADATREELASVGM